MSLSPVVPVLASMPDLNVFQYNTVDNIFSMTVATMAASALFFFLMRSTIAEAYRPALTVSGIVTAIAAYHYFMIRHSWQDAFVLMSPETSDAAEAGAVIYQATGAPFNDFYRYADWILTVPLLMVELVAVLRLEKSKATSLLTRLVIAAALMIGLGYPGEVIADPERYWERVIWGSLSSVPFFYILYVLWVELTASLNKQPAAAQGLIKTARLVILITWAVYPIAYALGGTPEALNAKAGVGDASVNANGIVYLQVGYAIADMTAKAGFGVLIYFIARAKTAALEEAGVETEATPAVAPAAAGAGRR
ncbi:MAG: bacteriorhodopsin-like, partial [Planctomycetota bacterium]